MIPRSVPDGHFWISVDSTHRSLVSPYRCSDVIVFPGSKLNPSRLCRTQLGFEIAVRLQSTVDDEVGKNVGNEPGLAHSYQAKDHGDIS